MRWLELLVEEACDQLEGKEREALWVRGVSDEQIEQYQIGYLNSSLPTADYPKHFLAWWHEQAKDGVFVYPLTTTLGHIRGIQLRCVDPDRKGYTDYIADKEEPVLFGLAQAMKSVWESESICLVEGVHDLFPIQRHFPGVVSTLHAGIPGNFRRTLRRLIRQLYIAYDKDSAGLKASFEIAKEYGGQFDVRILKYPKIPYRKRHVKDPCELWEVWGDKRLGVYLLDQLKPNPQWRPK